MTKHNQDSRDVNYTAVNHNVHFHNGKNHITHGHNPGSGEVLRSNDTFEYVKVLILRTVGNFLVLASLFLIARTFYQPVREEIRYFVEARINKVYIVSNEVSGDGSEISSRSREPVRPGGLAAMLNMDRVEVLVPDDPAFSVVIPKIGANARVVKNVSAADEEVYFDALQYGVAHVEGTAFPGEDGHIFLFAHSTDYVWNVGSYNAVFYLLYKLVEGDEINLFFNGKRHVYKVTGTQVVDPNEIEYLTRKTETEFLTLQTCWPPGTTMKRLLVFAEKAEQ